MPADELIMNNAFIDFNRRMGILASGDYSVAPEVFETIVKQDVTGTPIETSARMQEVFFDNVRMYLTDTNQAMLLNDVSNTNNFVKDAIGKELERTSMVRDKTFNHINKTRQRYMAKKYAIRANQFYSGVLQYTILVIIICAFVAGQMKEENLSPLVAGIIAGSTVFIYLILLLVFIKQNQIRRKDDWDKFYFPATIDKNNKAAGGSCS
jgi:hypothetical protein